jgi:phosphoenolpyruvate carboxylase
VTFFDGRGGPAARGGGKTHNFYTAHGKSIENTRIHLTVQGQTVSSNFGTVMSAQYNIEHLLSASLRNRLYSQYNEDFSEKNRSIMEMLSQESHRTYMDCAMTLYFCHILSIEVQCHFTERQTLAADQIKETQGKTLL